MKRFIYTLLLMFVIGLSAAKAISYEDARREAWFLTDKMAYELNLTPEQFDRAYQVNLDYLMSINRASDCYGYYWTYRDADLRCILFDWQYSLYTTLDYFYRPIRWLHATWYFPIFDRYRRGYYYFNRPSVYASYRGGMWRRRGHNDRSPYHGMAFRPGGGMRDHYHNGGRPPHRPEFGRPGNPGNNHRPSNGIRPGTGRPGNDNARPGNGNVKPDKGNKPGNNSRPGNGHSRPSLGLGTTGNGTYSQPGRGNSRPSSGISSQKSRPVNGANRTSDKRASLSSGSSRTFGNR